MDLVMKGLYICVCVTENNRKSHGNTYRLYKIVG